MGFKQWLIFALHKIFIPGSLKTMEWTMLRLVNRDRRRHGLTGLFMQDDLRKVARLHSKEMARMDYFEHENWRGQTHVDRLQEAKVTDVFSGENLAKIGGYPNPVHRAEIGLMNSPGHRANILNEKYNCVGIGIHKSQRRVYYYTQNFAFRTLLFPRRIPKSVIKNKGLKLHFKPVIDTNSGVYRVLDQTGVIQEKGFPIQKGKNMLQIPFSEIGNFEIQIFSSKSGSPKLNLTNKFTIRVTKGWF